mmetsp:Transcript_8115/g.7956  ORF Transcript_8115/g.7956 Transcript_8115/m.7956 type:complete len:80 (-) Transcript_8115:109-348(-)
MHSDSSASRRPFPQSYNFLWSTRNYCTGCYACNAAPFDDVFGKNGRHCTRSWRGEEEQASVEREKHSEAVEDGVRSNTG